MVLPRRRLRLGVIVVASLAIILMVVGVWRWLSPGPAPVQYRTALVDRGPVSAAVTATGTVNPVVSVQVGSQVSGKVQALYADFNTVVKKGQLVAQIDPEPFEARATQARAALKNARGILAKAKNMSAQRKLELDRAVALRKQQFVSQADVDLARTNYLDAEAQVEIGQAQVDQAFAALASAELDLGYTKIYSPEDGIVISRNVDVGQTVAASFQTPVLFLIAQDLTRMQVNANVSEADIGGVAEGKRAEFTVDAYPTKTFHGLVSQVRNSPVSIQNVVTYDVMIDVDNTELKLKPGMTANVSIVAYTREQTLRVPNAALRFKPPGRPTERRKFTVWVPDEQGQPRPVPVVAGLAGSSFTEIKENNLKEGTPVIVGMETADETGRQQLPPGFGTGPRFR